jgi:hypothetical protein
MCSGHGYRLTRLFTALVLAGLAFGIVRPVAGQIETATPTQSATATATTTVSAMSTASSTPTPTRTPTATRTPTPTEVPGTRLRLPAIAQRYPSTRLNSGLHLGNRQGDWNQPTDFLARLDLSNRATTPRVVVVLSSQVFDIRRANTAPCAITGAGVRNPVLFDSLSRSMQSGAQVVVRIFPSPGNFADYADPGATHVLLSGSAPAGPDYCDGRYNVFRSVTDVAAEINAIVALVTATHGWNPGSLHFEPANEPNLEWYAAPAEAHPDLAPAVYDHRAWVEMDRYFSAVYDAAKRLNPNIRVLTPPMGQYLFADEREFGKCDLQHLIVNGPALPSAGYDWMQSTFTTKNDGWSWHNYWRAGYEVWRDDFCRTPGSVGDHVFQYFPGWLQSAIVDSHKPAFITEADLLSPCVFPLNPLTDKDAQPEAAAESIWRFIQEERAADYVAVWVLTNQFSDPVPLQRGGNCRDVNAEIAWHEAYRETALNGTHERPWFPLWWLRAE